MIVITEATSLAIGCESGEVEATLNQDVTGHVPDFIALDGTVSLSLAVASAIFGLRHAELGGAFATAGGRRSTDGAHPPVGVGQIGPRRGPRENRLTPTPLI